MAIYNPGAGFRVGRRFGRQMHPITKVVTGHGGDDWPATQGTPIPCAYDGTIANVAYQYNEAKGTGWGHYVDVRHTVNGASVLTRYAHMPAKSTVVVGNPIKKGETVGLVGSSGGSTGPHLHFEIRDANNTPINPSTFDWPDGAAAPAATGWVYPFPPPPAKTEAKAADAKNPEAKPPEAKPPAAKPADAKPMSESQLYYGEPATRLGALGRNESGFYPIGANALWHGGMHFDRATNSVLHQKDGARCVYDGEVVAYLIDRQYPESDFTPAPRKAAYSTGLTLIRHKLQIPEAAKPPAKPAEAKPAAKPAAKAPPIPQPRPASLGGKPAPPPPLPQPRPDPKALAKPVDAKPPVKPADAKPADAKADAKADEAKKKEEARKNTLVFYSLYMHQLDFKAYKDDRELRRPAHWGTGKKFRAGDKAKDQQAAGAPGWNDAAAATTEPELMFANAGEGTCNADDDDDAQVC